MAGWWLNGAGWSLDGAGWSLDSVLNGEEGVIKKKLISNESPSHLAPISGFDAK